MGKPEQGETTAYFDDGLGLDEVRTTAHDDRRLVLRRERIHGVPQRLEICEPARAVSVDHQETVTARVEHPMSDRPALAEVLFELDDADVGRGVLGGEREREGSCVVFGAVVDDEEFVGALGVCVGRG